MFQTSNSFFKNTFVYKPSKAWEVNLDNASNYVIEQTGLSKEQLYKVLEILDENRIIS